MHLTSHITHSNGYAPYIAYYRSNGYDEGNKDYERRKHNKRYNVTDNSQVFHDYLDDWEKICLNMHL